MGFIKFFSIHAYSGYLNHIYTNAALGQRNWLDFDLYTFPLLTLIISSIYFVMKTRVYNSDITSNISVILNKNSQIDKKSESDTKTIANTEIKAKLDSDINPELKKTSSKLSETEIEFLTTELRLANKHAKRSSIINIIAVTLFILLLIDQIFSAFVDLQINASFNQRINAIAPYVNDQQIKILKSNWARMKSREDYEKVNTEFEHMADTLKIKLPEVLFK